MFTVLIQFYFAICHGLFASYIVFYVPMYLVLGTVSKNKTVLFL